MNYFKSIILIVFALLTGCSTAGWYEGMKARHQLECQNQPSSEYKDCMQQADKSFSEYEKEREGIENGQ
ncbi:MAG: hypothetical protein OQL09_10535 [Gammaproteobacteria bacterium]|nr:hypothetical protein [Gammaproteobacteria bacterium]